VSFSSEVAKIEFHPSNTNITKAADNTHNREKELEHKEQSKVKKQRLKNRLNRRGTLCPAYSWSETRDAITVIAHVKNIKREKLTLEFTHNSNESQVTPHPPPSLRC
jgi:hypothetical protein